MTDLHDAMRASEFASLAAFARAVLARARADNPAVENLTIVADVLCGEIEVSGAFHDGQENALEGFGL